MECKRCTLLPVVEFSDIGVCLTIPTRHHVEPISQYLTTKKITYEQDDDTFIFRAPDFCCLLDDLNKMGLSSVEQRDIRLLPFPFEEGLNYRHLNKHRNLQYWTNLIQSRDFLQILSNSSIQVLFQPIVEASSGNIYGYEGLSRGILPDGSQMMPGELFDHARKTDMVFFLDRICRESVIAAAAAQNISSKIFINFVPTSIYDPDKCLQTTDAALRKHGLDPRQIVFEVVETEYVEDFTHLNRILDYYKNKGYTTALDDMGSGYSTHEALLDLKPDYLKIDMDIIRNVHQDPIKQNKLAGFIKLGKEHNILILAEGVETEAELSYVHRAGVDLIQGYYFGRPQEEVQYADIHRTQF